MDVSEAQKLKTLESMIQRLNKLLAEAHLDIEALKVVARGKP
jgi:putative transposase